MSPENTFGLSSEKISGGFSEVVVFNDNPGGIPEYRYRENVRLTIEAELGVSCKVKTKLGINNVTNYLSKPGVLLIVDKGMISEILRKIRRVPRNAMIVVMTGEGITGERFKDVVKALNAIGWISSEHFFEFIKALKTNGHDVVQALTSLGVGGGLAYRYLDE